jgi:hypothetical protein
MDGDVDEKEIAWLVTEWKAQRKGVNRDADPWLASAYGEREIGGPRMVAEQNVLR